MLLYVEGHWEEIEHIANIFGMPTQTIGLGLRYMGFNIKPNNYRVND